MSTPTDFARLLTRFLGQYLPAHRNLSQRTIQSYRDTFKLLLQFGREERGWVPEHLTLAQMDRACLEAFLDWLETTRHCGVATRNQRLAALRTFFRWVAYEAPESLEQIQRILGIAWKKTRQPTVTYLTPDAMQALLAQPDGHTARGRRDRTLLALLYDTGARVQELVDIRVRDLRLTAPAVLTLTGKGNKRRVVPLMAATATLVAAYMAERRLDRPDCQDEPLFFSQPRRALTRWGVTYILQKYAAQARAQVPGEIPETVSPHLLRHSKAMHLLQAGVNLIYIRDFLGHSNVSTTEIYARADAEMKRRALESATIPRVDIAPMSWTEDADLMQWLAQLGR
ncbi:MAG: tyrosine-type recombinase/integrase [Firmicutes bacterium]|nr:tyrosine-type recombinase/integrase [Bacillota bacterium]